MTPVVFLPLSEAAAALPLGGNGLVSATQLLHVREVEVRIRPAIAPPPEPVAQLVNPFANLQRDIASLPFRKPYRRTRIA